VTNQGQYATLPTIAFGNDTSNKGVYVPSISSIFCSVLLTTVQEGADLDDLINLQHRSRFDDLLRGRPTLRSGAVGLLHQVSISSSFPPYLPSSYLSLSLPPTGTSSPTSMVTTKRTASTDPPTRLLSGSGGTSTTFQATREVL
jgi:hypothetical protein